MVIMILLVVDTHLAVEAQKKQMVLMGKSCIMLIILDMAETMEMVQAQLHIQVAERALILMVLIKFIMKS